LTNSSTMKESFISLVAGHLLKRPDVDLRDVAIIFPNRRAGNLFRRELVGRIEVPVWSPGIFSIDDWLTGLSGLQRTERLSELALLFPVVGKYIPHIRKFVDFLDLGELLLADFEDTDKYLADPKQLFSGITAIKRLESKFDPWDDGELAERLGRFWESFSKSHSPHQEKWLETWEHLYDIYGDFTNGLLSAGSGTSGMCYRKAADDLLSGKATTGRFRQVAFAGFNILTGAEERIFTCLRDRGVASFYWDYHPWYADSRNEAGRFLMNYVERFPPPSDFAVFDGDDPGFFGTQPEEPSILVSPVTSNTGQVQLLLNDLLSRAASNCGIVLSDESLFPDLLTSWPDEQLPVNFTSGYPLNDTLAAGLVTNLLDIFVQRQMNGSNHTCRPESLAAFMNHPWTVWLAGEDPAASIRQMERQFSGPVPAGFIDHHPMWGRWLGQLETPEDLLQRVILIIDHLRPFEADFYVIEMGALDELNREARQFLEVMGRLPVELDAISLNSLFRRFIRTRKITLETDREAAFQVTGVLETRLVDFDEVHILSFNEGIWPSGKLPGSLIPYSVRRVFNLPTAESRDAMYAYYFYRLIQRTGKVRVYFLTGHRDDRIRSGEKSRYLTQLQFAFPDRVRILPEPPVRIGQPSIPLSIPKEGAVLEKLQRYLVGHPGHKRLSPSAINEYIDCGLRFALKRIYDLKEPEEVSYASENKGFGILVHRVMNRMYSELEESGQAPGREWFGAIRARDGWLKEMIREEYDRILDTGSDSSPGGQDLLAIEVARQFILSILELDSEDPPLRIVALEKEYEMQFPAGTGDREARVTLFGFVDRIDAAGSCIRIIDYKTGSSDLNIRDIANLFDSGASKRPGQILQVLLYCELYQQQAKEDSVLVPCLFRPARFRAGDYSHRVSLAGEEFVYSGVRESFLQGLRGVLDELFDPQIPFRPAEDEKVCRYCPFAGICSR
jgi:hypothetical protein